MAAYLASLPATQAVALAALGPGVVVLAVAFLSVEVARFVRLAVRGS